MVGVANILPYIWYIENSNMSLLSNHCNQISLGPDLKIVFRYFGLMKINVRVLRNVLSED